MITKNGNFMLKDVPELIDSGEMLFDEPFQRAAGQWTKDQNSLLIDSIIRGYKIPPVWVEEVNSSHEKFHINVIDGRQRLTCIYLFMKDKFKLSKDIDPYVIPKEELGKEAKEDEVYELAGKKFSQLPEFIQKNFNHYRLEQVNMIDFTEEQKEEQFYRLNNGALFTKQQKISVILGSELAKKLKVITNHKFWERSGLTNAQKKHDVPMEVTLKTLMLLTGYDYGSKFNSNAVIKFANYYKDNYNQKEIDYCYELFTRLDKVIPNEKDYNKFLKAINIPNLIMQLDECLGLEGEIVGTDIVDDSFYTEYFTEFINYVDTTEYVNNCGQGSTDKTKVDGRQEALHKQWTDFCESLEDSNNSDEAKSDTTISENTDKTEEDLVEDFLFDTETVSGTETEEKPKSVIEPPPSLRNLDKLPYDDEDHEYDDWDDIYQKHPIHYDDDIDSEIRLD